MALPILDYPLTPALIMVSLPLKFHYPAPVWEELYNCALEGGEIRSTVAIHYMPHRMFETPILSSCAPVEEETQQDDTGRAERLFDVGLIYPNRSKLSDCDHLNNMISYDSKFFSLSIFA